MTTRTILQASCSFPGQYTHGDRQEGHLMMVVAEVEHDDEGGPAELQALLNGAVESYGHTEAGVRMFGDTNGAVMAKRVHEDLTALEFNVLQVKWFDGLACAIVATEYSAAVA